VKQPTVFTVEALHRYPMVSRVTFLECGGNSAPIYSKEPIQANVQALHGLMSCAEWTGVKLSTLFEEAGIDPAAEWFLAEGADAPTMHRSIPVRKAMDECPPFRATDLARQCRRLGHQHRAGRRRAATRERHARQRRRCLRAEMCRVSWRQGEGKTNARLTAPPPFRFTEAGGCHRLRRR